MNSAEYAAIEGNSSITGRDEDLLRQVPEDQRPAGKPSKQAFLPSTKDGGLLSTRRAAMGERQAYDDHVAGGWSTSGTWHVNVGHAIDLDLPCIDDAAHVGVPHHASVSFLDHESRGQREQRARKLARASRCLYEPPAEQ